jgi:hypothetical protein
LGFALPALRIAIALALAASLFTGVIGLRVLILMAGLGLGLVTGIITVSPVKKGLDKTFSKLRFTVLLPLNR